MPLIETVATSLGGVRATDVRLAIPAWGASYADVTLDVETTLSGRVTLVVADLTIHATVLSGGPASGRSFYRVVAGAGGWGQEIPRRSYANDAGVQLLTILVDAATEVGETFDTTTIDPTIRIGPAFVRPADQACRLLEQFAPGAWYVGEDGKTRLGQRPASTLVTKADAVSQLDLAKGTVQLAFETIAGVLPGLVVDGLVAVDVEHTVSAKGGLRSTIWGKRGAGNSRRLAAWRAIAEQMDPERQFRGLTEYRIVTQTGNRLNLQPIRVSTGMPDLQRVSVRPGVPGCAAAASGYALGSRVLVGFLDSNPAYPVVVGFEDPDGAGYVPPHLLLQASTLVEIAGGAYFLTPAPAMAAVVTGLQAMATAFAALPSPLTPLNAIGTALNNALLPLATGPLATTKTKAS